jgi:UDP-glucuronate decarboxylase
MPTACQPEDINQICDGISDLLPELSGSRILVAGGQGFLGQYFSEVFAHLNRGLLDQPCEVVILDNLITGRDGAGNPDSGRGIKWLNHNVIEPFESEERFDFIIHAAGIASPFYYRKFPLETLEVSTTGTKNLLNLARDHGAKIIFFSSSEIYGDPDPKYVPTPESYRGNVSCLGPRACYDESKRLGETLCRIYHEQFGVQSRMVRPFNVYGPGMNKLDYRVLPNFAAHIIDGQAINVYGDGTQTRTYCYITDAMTGFLKVLVNGSPGEPYNIGNPEPEISVLQLVEEIEGALDQKIEKHIIDYPDSYPADEPLRRCPDITKARLQLGYEPRVPLADGLKRFFSWAEDAYRDTE